MKLTREFGLKKSIGLSIGLMMVVSFLSMNAIALPENQGLTTQAEYDGLDIIYYVEGPNTLDQEILNIYVEVKSADTGETIEISEIEVKKYHVYKDQAGNEELMSGNLEFSETNNQWEARNINLLWTGDGTFYVTIEFKTTDMAESIETEISTETAHQYSRTIIMETMIISSIIIVIIVIAALVFVVKRMKEKGTAISGKTKTDKSEIKIKQISKEELKKKKTEKKKPKKGKTEVKEDLIFEVPQWEVDDSDEE